VTQHTALAWHPAAMTKAPGVLFGKSPKAVMEVSLSIVNDYDM